MKKIPLLALGFAVLMVACKKDDDTTVVTTTPQSTTIDLPETIVTTPISSDASTVSAALNVSSATRVSGTVPSPTSTPTTPVLSDPFGSSAKEKIFSGGTFGLPVATSDSDNNIKGLFVQVNGSSDYLDVPISALRKRSGSASLTASSSSNKKTGTTDELPIELPANFGIGEFCITYCVYDANNNVSNFITKCIVVEKLGGNSDFVKNWNMTSMVVPDYDSTSSGFKTVTIPGEFYSYSFDYTCNGTTKKISSSSNFDNFTLNLQSNGAFSLNYKTTDSGHDFSTNTDPCTAEVKTTTYTVTAIGGWSYNAVTGTLALVYQSQTINGTTTPLNDAFELKVDAFSTTQLSLADVNDSSIKYIMK